MLLRKFNITLWVLVITLSILCVGFFILDKYEPTIASHVDVEIF